MINFRKRKKKRKLIGSDILLKHHARLIRMYKDQLLFFQGDDAIEYYQIESGQVKMFILNEDGQEFTQGVFHAGESFGEPPLFGNFPYPSSAMATEDGMVWKLSKDNFISLLKNNFEVHLHLNQVLCNRLQYKSMILTEISAHTPEHRITTILTYLKSKSTGSAKSIPVIIPYTRQQLADMTGLRVETVIRTVKRMERDGKLTLEGHKIKY